MIVPEAASLLINAGLQPHLFEKYFYQETILDLVLTLEYQSQKLAQSLTDKPVLMIHDRGALDGKAYCGAEVWAKLLEKYSLSEVHLRNRYDGIIHLVSSADGASSYYGARMEAPGLALEIDRKLRSAWSGHPHHRVVDNSTDFQTKMEQVLVEIGQLLGAGDEIGDSLLKDPRLNRYGLGF